MAKSISQLQNEIVTESYIQSLSDSKADFSATGELPATQQIIIAYAAAFIQKVQANLRQKDLIDTGTLETDITQGQLKEQGGKYELDVGYPANSKAAKYYDFVNKGVKGFTSGQPNSLYSFKSAYPSKDGPMIKAILAWVKRQGITSRKETKGSTISSLQRKRKSIAQLDPNKNTAYMIARSIKRKGLPKSGFFDSAVAEYFESGAFAETIAKSAGADVRVYIKQAQNIINKENK